MHTTPYQQFAEPGFTQSHDLPANEAQHADACEAAVTFFRDYARERPEVVALWALGIGFVLGWKMKPW